MRARSPRAIAATLASAFFLTGCFTDAATRLAGDIESATTRVGAAEGARFILTHNVPSKQGECTGPYRVQFDRVGALIIWCLDESGQRTVSSHSTSHHARFVDTPQTIEVTKQAASPLRVELERHNGRVAITGAM